MRICFTIVFILLLVQFGNSQKKKDKNFSEGYIIRFGDTVLCRIYTKSNDICHEVTFKYPDDREFTYTPGSAVKGFGFKTDSSVNDYYAFSRKKTRLFNSKYENVYGLVLANGYFKLLKYTETKNNGGTFNPGGQYYTGTTTIVQYYLNRPDKDSIYIVNSQALFGPGIDEDALREYFNDFPELVAKIKNKMKLNDLIEYVKEFNILYEEKKKKEQTAN